MMIMSNTACRIVIKNRDNWSLIIPQIQTNRKMFQGRINCPEVQQM